MSRPRAATSVANKQLVRPAHGTAKHENKTQHELHNAHEKQNTQHLASARLLRRRAQGKGRTRAETLEHTLALVLAHVSVQSFCTHPCHPTTDSSRNVVHLGLSVAECQAPTHVRSPFVFLRVRCHLRAPKRKYQPRTGQHKKRYDREGRKHPAPKHPAPKHPAPKHPAPKHPAPKWGVDPHAETPNTKQQPQNGWWRTNAPMTSVMLPRDAGTATFVMRSGMVWSPSAHNPNSQTAKQPNNTTARSEESGQEAAAAREAREPTP